jgi:hypothetical protein
MLLQWNSPGSRIIRKADLGLEDDTDDVLEWSAATRYTQEVTEEEWAEIKKSGGSWTVLEVLDSISLGEVPNPPYDVNSSVPDSHVQVQPADPHDPAAGRLEDQVHVESDDQESAPVVDESSAATDEPQDEPNES